MSISAYRKAMIPLVTEKLPEVGFLSSFFQTPESNIRQSPTIEVEIKRKKNFYPVDIAPATGIRFNKRSLYTNKEYMPPAYKEGFILRAEELQKKLAGENPYDAEKTSYIASAVAIMTEDALDVASKIKLGIEKQASDAFFNGSITLVNGDTINYSKKGTHNVTPTTKWNATGGDPIADITALCQVIRRDSLSSANTFDMIVDEAVLNALYANQIMKDRANFRRADLITINMPKYINQEGASFHGIISAGSNTIYLWTYTADYTIPEGFGLANEGTKQNLIPSEACLLLARNSRYDLVYAGIPRLYSPMSGFPMPTGEKGKALPFVYEDKENEAIKYGLESRPLCIPTEIDTFGTFVDTLT